ncbi:MAG: DUF922 domain-containing protein [Sphingomonas sp.]|nr:DUF922 domain-containing protein [Sphingomonas sp.]
MLILTALIAMAEPSLSMDPPPINRDEVPRVPYKAPAVPAVTRKLSTIPGVTVSYYDAVGKNVRELHDWLDRHGPRDPQTHRVLPATSNWSISSGIKFSKTGGQCTITGATVKFTATARLPRLAPGQKLSPEVLATWNSYVAALEDRQAAQLAFVYDRVGEVQSAIMRSNCANWQKAAGAAIDRLGQGQAAAFRPDPKTQPKLLEPEKAN